MVKNDIIEFRVKKTQIIEYQIDFLQWFIFIVLILTQRYVYCF